MIWVLYRCVALPNCGLGHKTAIYLFVPSKLQPTTRNSPFESKVKSPEGSFLKFIVALRETGALLLVSYVGSRYPLLGGNANNY